MRRYLRAIAHAKMKAEGIQHPNRKEILPNGSKGKSYFARNGRKYA